MAAGGGLQELQVKLVLTPTQSAAVLQLWSKLVVARLGAVRRTHLPALHCAMRESFVQLLVAQRAALSQLGVRLRTSELCAALSAQSQHVLENAVQSLSFAQATEPAPLDVPLVAEPEPHPRPAPAPNIPKTSKERAGTRRPPGARRLTEVVRLKWERAGERWSNDEGSMRRRLFRNRAGIRSAKGLSKFQICHPLLTVLAH